SFAASFWGRGRRGLFFNRRSRRSEKQRLHGASTIAAWLACKPLCCVGKSRRHTARTGGRRLPILPDCNRSVVSCSPLEGDCRPPRRRTAPDPQGSGFSLAMGESPASSAHAPRALAYSLRALYFVPVRKSYGRRPMAWTIPTLVEICVGLEINGYLPAEFWACSIIVEQSPSVRRGENETRLEI